MTYVREQLRQRLGQQVRQAWWRWLHPPADVGQATASWSRGHPQAAEVSAADINRPDTDQPSGHRPRFQTRQRTSTASAVSGSATPWTPAAVSGWAAGCGRTAADPLPPFRHHGSAAHVALARLCWSRRPGRRSRPVAAVQTHGHRTRPAGQREPARPDTADTHDCRRGMRALRQRPRGCRQQHHAPLCTTAAGTPATT